MTNDKPTVSEKAEWDQLLKLAISEHDYEYVRAAVQRALDEREVVAREDCVQIVGTILGQVVDAMNDAAAEKRSRGNDGY